MKQFWVKQISQLMTHYDIGSLKLTKVQLAALIQRFAPVATGVVVIGLLFKIFIQLLFARGWQSALFSPGSLRHEFIGIRISRVFAVLLIAASVGLYWHPLWLVDVYWVLTLPFMVAGLSLLHNVTGQKKAFKPLLLAVYAGLVVGVLALGGSFTVLKIMVIGLALVGFMDSWCDFRKRYSLLSV